MQSAAYLTFCPNGATLAAIQNIPIYTVESTKRLFRALYELYFKVRD